MVDATDTDFAAGVRAWAQDAGIPVAEDDGARQYDDIVVLDSDPESD